MKMRLMIVMIGLSFCTLSQAFCAWTFNFCDSDGRNTCYSKGTAGCRDTACHAEQRAEGDVYIYENNQVISQGKYDFSKSLSENCTEASGPS